jgi:Ran GTPase-activating protein 1
MAEQIAPRSFSIKLWPPSDNTRQVIVERMTKNLSTETFFSKKYRLFSKEEAHKEAVKIEEAGFKASSELFMKEPDGDGSSAVQFYAKETSRLMIETLKRGPTETPKVETETTREVETDAKMETETIVVSAENGTRRDGAVFDISNGKRAFIEAEEVQELLSPLGQTSNWYTKIVFSNRSFGIDAARVAGPILESIKNQLLDVDLSDFVAGRPEEEALEVMKIFSLALEGSILRYLNLSDNAMGEKGVRAFEALLSSQKDLEELYLMNDGISEEAAKALSELIPSTEKLKVLHFHNNMTGDGAVAISEVIKKSPLLENFRCSSTRVGTEGGVALAEALGACVNMKKLDLRDNLFGVVAGLALSKTITKLTCLKEIYLSYLNLEDEGTKEIVNALKSAVPGLEVLELAGNEITAAAAPVLATLLGVTQNLKKLVLSENELKDEGSIVIAKALEGQTGLKELDLSSNLIQRAGARALANAVVNKEGFELLNINGNAISDEGLDEVKEIFKGSDVLGPLDENDVDLLEEEDEDGEEEGEERELEAKLGHLNVESED